MQTGKKLCAILLTLCMLVGVLPASVLATGTDTAVLGRQLMLGDDLCMHLHTNVSQELANPVATISVAGVVAETYNIREMTAQENGSYDLSVHLGAPQMTDIINLRIVDGETEVLNADYTIQGYIQYLLDNNYTDETKALAKSLLHYGAKAQLYFDYNTKNPADAGNEIEVENTISAESPNVVVDGAVEGIKYYGSSMVFRSKIAIRYYFATNAATSYTYKVNGKEIQPAIKEGQCYIEVANINPDQMDQEMLVEVSDGTSQLSFRYSPNAFITRMYNRDTTDQELKDLLVAAKHYFDAAKVFTGVAENRTGALSLQYRYGTSDLIQVNTNLPADTPCVNFTAGDNGSSIDQSANQYQQFGWVGMDNVDGTIVLTFHFNGAFEAGQTYVLPKGAVFGFTDNSKYTLDKNYTFTFDGSGWTMVAAEPAITLEYRWGNENTIQYNTNLPATTPIANFLATDNGCSLTQNVQVGWIGMDNVDGVIVLTFHFNGSFNAGENYILSAGSVFGFADGSKYQLNEDVTLYWDGSNWSTTEPVKEITLDYRWGNADTIQYNTNLPATTPIASFTASENGSNLIQTANQYQNVGWIGMDNVDGTIVLTFHFNGTFNAGENYVLSAGSVFGFTDGSKYQLNEDVTLYWDGSNWSTTEPVKEITLDYRWGNANTIQYNTNLPATTPIANFTASENGSNLIQTANQYQNVGWIGMADAEGTIVLTFNFNGEFAIGQNYILSAGSVFGFTDGSKYQLNQDIILYWDGSNWSTTEPVKEITLDYRWGNANTIQYNTNLPATTPIANFTASENGSNLIQTANQYQNVGWIGMADAEGTIVLTFNFNGEFAFGQNYILSAGSVFGFTDGSSYTLPADVNLYWDGANWGVDVPVLQDVLDEENFTGGKEFITFADLPVNGNNATKLAEYVALGFNTSLLTEDHTDTKGPDERYSVSLQTANEPSDSLNFTYRYGTSNLIQVNTNLPSDTPCVNFTVGDNECDIDQSGNTVQWVGWIGMDNVDGVIVLTFHFNNAFTAGQSYVLPKDALFGFTDGNMYLLDGDYTFTFDGTNWSTDCSVLKMSLNSGAAKYMQLKTNIPTGLTYGDFLLGDTAKGNLILEITEGAQSVAWFSYSELSGAVYLTFNFTGYNKPGTQYILKAGTSLKAGDKVYTTDRDYILTVQNDYLTALENLDKAGLKVWIRNHHNKADYFTSDLTSTLLLYKDVIDGFYMVDEAFQTNALLTAAGQENKTSDFESMTVVRDWFNQNFADKYYHSNHVPITSIDHYTVANGSTQVEDLARGYVAFLQDYKTKYNDQLTAASGTSISFDNYPFVHAQGDYKYGTLNLKTKFESGIQSTYLANCLIAAQVAAEDDLGLCIQTFEATDMTYKVTRDITSAAEVSLQLYTGMAMGADLFEYFAYNSNSDFDAIMNLDGSKRIYDLVKKGNEALCFADVVNTFSWNGIMTSAGSVNSHNTVGFGYVAGMVLNDSNNGVLSSVSSTDDAIVGCFAKDDLNGYMVVNFNDPVAVTGNNTVTLTFAGCTRARVYTNADGVLTSQLVDLTDGTYTATLVPGSACFVIPA